MKVAIMQPYFFPYVGYFQLINAVDKFVIYDDVNYIKGGWINRNYILSQSKRALITLHLVGASSNKLINQVELAGNQQKLMKTIQQSYSKAPYYNQVIPILERVLLSKESNLARFLELGLREVSDYLGINSEWLISSDLEKENSLRGQEKVLAICKKLGATEYINLPGGRSLYDSEIFLERGIQLSFIEPKSQPYYQNRGEFIPSLSVIDLMMFNEQQFCNSTTTAGYEVV
jgi:hypothetical protein